MRDTYRDRWRRAGFGLLLLAFFGLAVFVYFWRTRSLADAGDLASIISVALTLVSTVAAVISLEISRRMDRGDRPSPDGVRPISPINVPAQDVSVGPASEDSFYDLVELFLRIPGMRSGNLLDPFYEKLGPLAAVTPRHATTQADVDALMRTLSDQPDGFRHAVNVLYELAPRSIAVARFERRLVERRLL